jgi:choline dehydrogenase
MSDFEYIIIGSGAGGGPLAANLARAGFKVLLLDAGGDPCADNDLGRWMYEVPIFHGLSTEYPDCSWNYFVRHYTDEALQRRDTKYRPQDGGVWYPRAGTLGGCTAHNAMITVTPQACDWNRIATITGDESWEADNMNRYFTRLENCHYVPRPGSVGYTARAAGSVIESLAETGHIATDAAHGHGFDGWLTTSEADPTLALKDHQIIALLLNSVRHVLEKGIGRVFTRLVTRLDPNDLRNARHSPEGLAFTPLAVANGKRNGPREYLLRTRKEYPNNLTIQLNALTTRVLFENKRAVGVEILEGKHLYEADPQANGAAASLRPRQITASREVIVSCGAFNSPQLLKLSGIGPRAELEKNGIPVICDLPGVGENLQDRYEVGVISEFQKPFALLDGATFAPPSNGGPGDPYFESWKNGQGIYASNGALIGILKRSKPSLAEPDLYIFGLPGNFRGYHQGYSKEFERFQNRFTWAVLKAYTNNTAGRVTLRSADPSRAPLIEFRYFSEGNDDGADLDAVVEGVNFVRAMNRDLGGHIVRELCPGDRGDTPEKLRQFIQDEAWGHHASCTNKIGADNDAMAVLDSRFRVRGVNGLRVVDASVFPRIPGYFIVSAIYMISEKASDVIAEDAR